MVSDGITLDLGACGMRAVFYWGAYKALVETGKYHVDCVHGRSSGAIVGVFMLIGLKDVAALYQKVYTYNQSMYIVDSWCRAMAEILPPDAYAQCSGRLFVTVAVLGVKPHTVSEFHSNSHMLEIIRASGSIPLVTTGLRISLVDGLPAFDGGLVDWWYTSPGLGTSSRTLRICAPANSWPERRVPITAYPYDVMIDSMGIGAECACRWLSSQPQTCITELS